MEAHTGAGSVAEYEGQLVQREGSVGCFGRGAYGLCSAQCGAREQAGMMLQPIVMPADQAAPAATMRSPLPWAAHSLPAPAPPRSRGQLPGLQPLQRVHCGHRLRRPDGERGLLLKQTLLAVGWHESGHWLRRQDGEQMNGAVGVCRTGGRRADEQPSTAPPRPQCRPSLPPPLDRPVRWRCGTCAT